MSRQGSRRTPQFPGAQGGHGSQASHFPGSQGHGGQFTPGSPGSQGGHGSQFTPGFPGSQGHGGQLTPNSPGSQGGHGSQFTPGFPGSQGHGGQLTPNFPGSQGGHGSQHSHRLPGPQGGTGSQLVPYISRAQGSQLVPYISGAQGSQLVPHTPGAQGGTSSQSHWAVARPAPPQGRVSDPIDPTRSRGGQSNLVTGPTPGSPQIPPYQGSQLNHSSYQNNPGSSRSRMGNGSDYSDEEEDNKKKKKGIPGWRNAGGKPASWRCDSNGGGLVRRKGEKKFWNWGFQIPDRALANSEWNDAARDPPPLGAPRPKKRKDEDE